MFTSAPSAVIAIGALETSLPSYGSSAIATPCPPSLNCAFAVAHAPVQSGNVRLTRGRAARAGEDQAVEVQAPGGDPQRPGVRPVDARPARGAAGGAERHRPVERAVGAVRVGRAADDDLALGDRLVAVRVGAAHPDGPGAARRVGHGRLRVGAGAPLERAVAVGVPLVGQRRVLVARRSSRSRRARRRPCRRPTARARPAPRASSPAAARARA